MFSPTRFAMLLLVTIGAGVVIAWQIRPEQPAELQLSRAAATLDQKIDWSRARLIAVQDAQRYKTLDSFARESITAFHGAEHLPGLSPIGSLCEWLFNSAEYVDKPMVRIKDVAIRKLITKSFSPKRQAEIVATGYMSLRELALPAVDDVLKDLEPRFQMRPAMIRTRDAQFIAQSLARMLCLMPQQAGDADTPWLSPEETIAYLPEDMRAALGGQQPQVREDIGPNAVAQADATRMLVTWAGLRSAWLDRDAARVQESVDKLAALLPTFAPPGVYPAEAQRAAEARYYAMGKFTWGWLAYFIGGLAGIWCMITRWRWAFITAQLMLLVGIGVHAYGVGLRWAILGHVPVANMFEAITGAALLCIALLVGLDLTDRFRGLSKSVRWSLVGAYSLIALAAAVFVTGNIWFKPGSVRSGYDSPSLVLATFIVLTGFAYLLISSLRSLPGMLWKPSMRPVFLFGANMAGFFALVVAGYVVPGGGTLSSIKGILDDVMLRVHTILIISSYAMIFVAAVIALVYVFGYYFHVAVQRSQLAGLATAFAGAMLWGASALVFGHDAEMTKLAYVGVSSAIFACVALALLVGLSVMRAPGELLMLVGIILVAMITLWLGNHSFVLGMGLIMLGGGLIWALLNELGLLIARFSAAQVAESRSSRSARRGAKSALGRPALALEGHPSVMSAPELWQARPIIAGAAPGDESKGAKLPAWLHTMDWSHLIILNMVFIMLFVGTILGAVWADYSWGRPWGWDPKEVFAMNTWLIYAVLIHSRFAVRDKGIWTAWLSIAGCLMMIFNWCYVNFFIVGMHSYA